MVLLLFSCNKKEESIGPTFDVTFNLKLKDQFGTILPFQRGTKLELASAKDTTVYYFQSNKLELKNVKSEVYNVIISKPGFATYKIFSLLAYMHFWGSNLPIELSEPCTIPLESASVSAIGANYVLTLKQRDDLIEYPSTIVYYNLNHPADSMHYFYFYTYGFSESTNQQTYSLDAFKNAHRLSSGDIVYLAVYNYSNSTMIYEDAILNKTIFPTINISSKIADLSFVIP
jgi:hypothetical protein